VYGKEKVEKWILRKAFVGLLPDHILNRLRQPFAQGSGTEKLTELIGQRAALREDYGYTQQLQSHIALKSEAEVYFYHIFKENFPGASFERLVTRWDPLTRQQNR